MIKTYKILLFGVGKLQHSLIERAHKRGLYVVGIDPCGDADCRDEVDAFEVVDGQDLDKTIGIAKKYQVSAVVTVATDKPLVMMAKVAEILHLPFYSVETAKVSTDKLLMKQRFMDYGIPCAKGFVLTDIGNLSEHDFHYPVIVKPRDNSGSRGVKYCNDEAEVVKAWKEAMLYTHKSSVLVEEYIDGNEYSIENVHWRGKSYVVQFTEKRITECPYNVELGHIQPADISEDVQQEIRTIIQNVAEALNFTNCCSHTELKISSHGIKVIETSPRLGGDFITSHLTPLSTGINMEDLLLKLSLGEDIQEEELKSQNVLFSGIHFFQLPEGAINEIGNLDEMLSVPGTLLYKFELKRGEVIHQITSSLNRYGYVLIQSTSREQLLCSLKQCDEILSSNVVIQ